MSDPQLHLLLSRVAELTAEVERLTDLLKSADGVVTDQ